MPDREPRFALNHIAAPSLPLDAFFALAADLAIDAVEIRNDIEGNAIADRTPPKRVRELAQQHGVRILSINALQRFDDWRAERPNQAVDLADYAAACGAEALVLVPTNDGSRPGRLHAALEALKPILASRGLTGLIEPLGFESCSLRLKSEAADAVAATGGARTFRLVHDTFHHHLAGEAAIFPEATGLVHISGVDEPRLRVGEMRDAHRVLVGPADRLGNLAQIRALREAGYDGWLSFEPFSAEVQTARDRAGAIRRSMDFLRAELATAAARTAGDAA